MRNPSLLAVRALLLLELRLRLRLRLTVAVDAVAVAVAVVADVMSLPVHILPLCSLDSEMSLLLSVL